MHEIVCPSCKKAFKIDEAGYADIVKQVRDTEFTQQLNERMDLAEKEKKAAVELAKQQILNEMQKEAISKDALIQDLHAKIKAKMSVEEIS